MLIGTPKTLAELSIFSKPEYDELVNGMTQLVASGTPLEVPAAIPLNQLARMSATLQAYRGFIQKVVQVEDGLETPELTDRWSALRAEAEKLLSAEPPKVSRLVV